MFDLDENQRTFYYQTYEISDEELDEDGNMTGEKKSYYSNPIMAKAMISENTSGATEAPFGKDLVYDKMISTVQDLPIDEFSRLFIDVEPLYNEDGSTDTKPDYKVVKVSKGLYQHVWAIRKVDGYVDNIEREPIPYDEYSESYQGFRSL